MVVKFPPFAPQSVYYLKMPFYSYLCESCGESHEEYHGMSDAHPSCPSCGEPYGESFHQDFVNYNQTGISYGNPTTVGQQGELNAKRIGKERMAMMEEVDKKRVSRARRPKGAKSVTAAKPWWRSGEVPGLPRMDSPLDVSTIKDQDKFIMTGETS